MESKYYNREKKRMYRVVIAHPERQHSFELAAALKQKGILYKYITTVYDRPNSFTGYVKKILKGSDLKKANGRKTDKLDNADIIQFNELLGLSFLALQRLPVSQSFAYKWLRVVNSIFSKKVGKYLSKLDIDAVIMFDMTAENCFKILKKERDDIVRIQDVSIATRHYMKHNFEKDRAVEKLKKEFSEFWNPRVMQGYQNEIDDSDYYLVASKMSMTSLKYCGVDESKVAVIPYGVDLRQFDYVEKTDDCSGPLRIIYVGQITYRKGIHHLIDTILKFNKEEVEVYLAGGYEPNGDLYNSYKNIDNVHFMGFVTRDILAQEYQKSDVFVFPTIGEGYGLVILEALGCGVPVITSDLAGGNDAIIEGENGFVFKAGNDEDLEEKLRWCLSHREELRSMRIRAHYSVQSFTWEKYYNTVADTVLKMVKREY